jgi:hypothetical protein
MFNTHDERLSSTHCIGCFMQAPEKHLCVAAASVRASHRLSMASPLFGCQNLQSFVKNLNKIEQIEWLECGIPPTQGLNPPTRLQPISFNAGSEGDLTSAGNQHSWRSVNNAGPCIVWLCHVRLSVESGNLSNISEYFFGHCGKKSHNPLKLRQKIQLWQDGLCLWKLSSFTPGAAQTEGHNTDSKAEAAMSRKSSCQWSQRASCTSDSVCYFF